MTDRQWAVAGKIGTVLIAIVAISAAVFVFVLTRRGFTARGNPTVVEARIARAMRRVAVPAVVRDRKNPLPVTPASVAGGREHWADHCASCHGNDGSGNTEMGRNLYPRAPDMRTRETQELTDGELFGIIRDGIPLSGMPAWGSERGSDEENWHLVHFIRHLPKITTEEIEAMERLNPKTPSEMQEMHQEDEFLGGGSPPAAHHHH